MSIMDSKYQIRREGETPTLVWLGTDDKMCSKPASPAEEHLAWQVSALQQALKLSMERNASYEQQLGINRDSKGQLVKGVSL